ncbi:hypothetical protein [Pleionea sp. CnH1-48]|uniref:hypothetical protein n=1 Tax=Pleionea sp. CnH1-48 TaxID=2954494 RepID=UPI0020986331|nr:hypothetical protein [Pleionea sp. CnH1-48]MCO7223227.1 hypothetical protein [Pleionea sp. CnH1-48]
MTPPFDMVDILKNNKQVDTNDLLTVQSTPATFKLDNPDGYFTVSNSAVYQIEVQSTNKNGSYYLKFYQIVNLFPHTRNGSLVGVGTWDPIEQTLSMREARDLDGCGWSYTDPFKSEFSGVHIKGLSHPSLSATTSGTSCALGRFRNCSYHSCLIWSDDRRFGKFERAYYIVKSKKSALKIYALLDKPSQNVFDDINEKIY